MRCGIEAIMEAKSPCEGMRMASQCISYYILGEKGVSAAITERGGGSDPSKVETKFKDGKLYGEKLFVTGADKARKFLVLAKSDDYVLVLADRKNVKIEPMNLKVYECAGISKVKFEGTEGKVVLEGREAYKAVLKAIAKSRLMIAALAYRIAEDVLKEGIKFVKERGIRHQVVRHRLAEAWAHLYVLRNSLKETDDWSEIASIKFMAVRLARRAVQLVLDSMGGYAFGKPLELYNHVLALEPAEGTGDIQLEIIARRVFG